MHFCNQYIPDMYGASQEVSWSADSSLPILLRRVVGGVVVTLLSNGHRLPLDGSAASLSQRHFCARQVRTVSHSAPEKKIQDSGNY